MLTLKCEICKKAFDNLDDVITHLKIHHNVPDYLLLNYVRIIGHDESRTLALDIYHTIKARLKDIKLNSNLDTNVDIDNEHHEIRVEVIVSLYGGVSINDFETTHNLIISAIVSHGIDPNLIRIKVKAHSTTYATLNYYITTIKLTRPTT